MIHEDAIKIGGFTKAPDYCFRIGGARKFFLEAKKPLVNIREDIHPAFQLRRYAWSSKLPLSILSDFEEFAVYDCRVKPQKADKASVARIFYMRFDEYEDRWDEIVSIFSRDAILKGSFDKYVESTKSKRGTADVDEAFLKEIETWRDILAKNIALRNPALSQRELNFAVQITIDRIIFLRICEDRGIEDYGRLMALQNGGGIYARLLDLYRKADARYNSGLFHFEQEKGRPETPDALTPKLSIDDKVLKDIFKGLYYPDSPYEFSVLPSDILGQVYEQFLGKVIRLTSGHRAVVEEKPEVKKAGGVYYTPTYIVDYIVKNTVGKLLGEIPSAFANQPPSVIANEPPSVIANEPPSVIARSEATKQSHGKDRQGTAPLVMTNKKMTPKEVAKLKILDPACGSGSFLIGAYQYLLDWHRYYYENDKSGKHAKHIYQSRSGEWRLTAAEKKRILLNNIYGVDIDSQAVEVTKLSLLLKVLEGETEESINAQMRLFQERALPDLSNNIKCGNSLIGPDFYDNQQTSLFDEEEAYRINVFDWQAEFPTVFASSSSSSSLREAIPDDKAPWQSKSGGGFDAVIGNPPYITYSLGKGMAKRDKSEIDYLINTYKSSVEYKINSFAIFYEKAVQLSRPSGLSAFIVPGTILINQALSKIRFHLLSHATLDEVTSLKYKVFPNAEMGDCCILFTRNDRSIKSYRIIIKQYSSPHWTGETHFSELNSDTVLAFPEHRVYSNRLVYQIFRIAQKENMVALGEIASLYNGIKTGNNKKFLSYKKETDKHKPAIRGRDFNRYSLPEPSIFVYFNPVELWSNTDTTKLGTKNKIIIRQTGDRLIATLESFGTFCLDTVHMIYESQLNKSFLLGIINSKLFNYFHSCLVPETGKAFAEVKIANLKKLPIPNLQDESSPKLNQIVSLVDQMLELYKKLDEAKTSHEQSVIQRQIDATDHQINQQVYQLYNLTPEEIKIIEESTKR